MSRPVSVTASAVVAIVGSTLALLFAAFAVASLFVQTTQPKPPNTAQSVAIGAAMFSVFACVGVWTSVGLFRLRPWARTSILVFAGFLATVSAFCLLLTMAVPIPASYSTGTEQTFRQVMAVMFGVPLAIAVWWLIQFNTPSIKAAFTTRLAEEPSPRPISVTVIALACIVGGVSSLMLILTRAPAFLFGAVFTGWTAGVFYAFFGALSLYIGKGLLDLRERARVIAIGWFVFSVVHASVVTLVPSIRHRMLDLQRSLAHDQPNPMPFDTGMMTSVIFVFVALTAAIAIWFLVRNRVAFARPERLSGATR